MSIFTWYEINSDTIKIKFDPNVQTSTLVNNNFILNQAISNVFTPVPGAFKDIVVSRDYYSISRSLTLYLNAALLPNTAYRLDISGLKDVSGFTLAPESINWMTSAEIPDVDIEPPTRDPVDVEDYSIKSISDFLIIPDSGSTNSSSISVVSTYPDEHIAYALKSTNAEGRIQLTFNVEIAGNYISSVYFKVQRKWIDSPTTPIWEDVSAVISSNNKDVYIYLPSDDATPVYGLPNHEYWLSGYKYRVRVLAGLGAA